MTDGGPSRQIFPKHSCVENLAYQPHAGMAMEINAIRDDDSRRFLPTMLLGEQTLVANLRCFFWAPNTKEPALLLLLVFVDEVPERVDAVGKEWKRHGHVKFSVVLADNAISTVR